MNHRFGKHYTREEATALVPQLRQWLDQLRQHQGELQHCDQRIEGMMAGGNDLGGDLVNKWIRTLASMQSILTEFQRREIQIKDIERGLVDFPAIIGGKEVFLCWEQDEDDVEFWHELDTGYAGREKL
jgi:hypothetical protein